MNTSRIAQAVRDIEECRAALEWLSQFGGGLTESDKDCAAVTVKLNYATAAAGAKEAEKMLTAFARFQLREIVRVATENCRNTIEMRERAIREEAAKEPTT